MVERVRGQDLGDPKFALAADAGLQAVQLRSRVRGGLRKDKPQHEHLAFRSPIGGWLIHTVHMGMSVRDWAKKKLDNGVRRHTACVEQLKAGIVLRDGVSVGLRRVQEPRDECRVGGELPNTKKTRWGASSDTDLGERDQ